MNIFFTTKTVVSFTIAKRYTKHETQKILTKDPFMLSNEKLEEVTSKQQDVISN